jgi:hypothetical protein
MLRVCSYLCVGLSSLEKLPVSLTTPQHYTPSASKGGRRRYRVQSRRSMGGDESRARYSRGGVGRRLPRFHLGERALVQADLPPGSAARLRTSWVSTYLRSGPPDRHSADGANLARTPTPSRTAASDGCTRISPRGRPSSSGRSTTRSRSMSSPACVSPRSGASPDHGSSKPSAPSRRWLSPVATSQDSGPTSVGRASVVCLSVVNER